MKLFPARLEDIGTWHLLRSGWAWASGRDWRLPRAGMLLAVTIIYLWLSRIQGELLFWMFQEPGNLPPETPYYELGSVLAPAIAAIFAFVLVVFALRKPIVPHPAGYFLTGLVLVVTVLTYVACVAGLAGICRNLFTNGRFPVLLPLAFALNLASLALVLIELAVGLKKHRWVWPEALLFHQTAAVLLMALSYHTTLGWWVDVIK